MKELNIEFHNLMTLIQGLRNLFRKKRFIDKDFLLPLNKSLNHFNHQNKYLVVHIIFPTNNYAKHFSTISPFLMAQYDGFYEIKR
jgi:hypothetical protein